MPASSDYFAKSRRWIAGRPSLAFPIRSRRGRKPPSWRGAGSSTNWRTGLKRWRLAVVEEAIADDGENDRERDEGETERQRHQLLRLGDRRRSGRIGFGILIVAHV